MGRTFLFTRSGSSPLARTICTILTVGFGASLAQAEDATKLTPLRVHHYQGLFINQNSYVAYYTGIFKKHGLDVTMVPLPSGPAVEAAVHAGSIEIGSQDL